jgi:hypothetical protein
MGGELGKAIFDDQGRVQTENRVEMPKFATFTTPVQVAMKPRVSTTFEIAHPTDGTVVTATVRQKD